MDFCPVIIKLAVFNVREQEYKPPASQDIPEDFRTTFFNTGNNPNGVLGSKCTGEPSVNMGVSVLFAIMNALRAAKEEQGTPAKEWFQLSALIAVSRNFFVYFNSFPLQTALRRTRRFSSPAASSQACFGSSLRLRTTIVIYLLLCIRIHAI